MSLEPFSDALYWKNLTLLGIASVISDIKEGSSVLDIYNQRLLSTLECLVLRMEHLSVYISTITKRLLSHSSETHDLLSIACGSEPEEVYFEDLLNSLREHRLLVNTFNGTIRLYDKKNKNDWASDVSNKLWKFLKRSLKALATFSMLSCNYGLSAEYHETAVNQTEKLAAILIAGKKFRVVFIVKNYLPKLLQYLKDNALIKRLLICLLGHAQTSKVFAIKLLEHISSYDTMKTIGEHSHEASILLSLFGDVLQSLILFPSHSIDQRFIERIIKFIGSIIRHAVELIPSASHPSNYFIILQSVFMVIKQKKIIHCYKRLYDYIPTVFNSFDVWLQTPPRCNTGHQLLETVLVITHSLMPIRVESELNQSSIRVEEPISGGYLLPYCQTFVKVILFSLNEEDPRLVSYALSMFQRLQHKFGCENINSQVVPLKQDLLLGLYNALRSPHKEVNEKVFDILGKFRGHNRDMFNKPTKVKDVSSSCSFFINFKDERGSVNLPLSKIIVVFACRDILKDNASVSTKKKWWPLVQIFLKQYIVRHKELVLQSTISSPLSVDKSYLQCTNINSDSSEVVSLVDCAMDASFEIYKTAFTAMFVAAETPELSDHIEPFLTETLRTVIENLITDNVQEENYHLVLFIDAAIEAVSLPKKSIDNVSMIMLERIVDTASSLKPANVWSTALLSYMTKQIIDTCYHQNLEAKLAGCRAMKYVLTKNWKIEYIQDFLKPLLYCLNDSCKKITFCVVNEAKSLLEEIFQHIESNLDKIPKNAKDEMFKEVNNILVEELKFHSDITVSDLIRKCIQRLCEIFETDLKELNFPHKFLKDVDFLMVLHEDYEFCKRLNTPLLDAGTEQKFLSATEKKMLYEKIKSYCSPRYVYHQDTVPPQSEVSRKIYGALYTLCFNFVEENTVDELFEIFSSVLNSAPEVSEAACNCLDYMWRHHEKMIKTRVWDWTVKILSLLKMKHPSYENTNETLKQLRGLLIVLQEFPTSKKIVEGYVESHLMIQLKIWEKSVIEQCLKKSPTVPDMETGTLLLECLNALSLKDENVLDEVLSLTVELQKHLVFPMSCSLKVPLQKLCQRFCAKSIFILFTKLKENAVECTTLPKALMKDEHTFLNEIMAFHDKQIYLKALGFHHFTELLSCVLKCNKIPLLKKKLAIYLLQTWHDALPPSFSEVKSKSLVKGLNWLVKSLLHYFKCKPYKFQILFNLMKAFKTQIFYVFQFLKDFVDTTLSTYAIEWKVACFRNFCSLFLENRHPDLVEIFQFIILPLFRNLFQERCGREFLISQVDVNDVNSPCVYECFLECLNSLSQHSFKMQHAFMRLITIIVDGFSEEEGRPFDLLIAEVRRFADSLKNSQLKHYGCLFLLMLECKEKDYDIESVKALCSALITCCSIQEKHVVQQAFYYCASKLSADEFFECFNDYFSHWSHFTESIFNLIVTYPKNFYSVHKTVVKWILSSLPESALKNLQVINRSVDLIRVIINWSVHTSHLKTQSSLDESGFIVSAEDADLILNLLFEIACIPHSDPLQKALSRKCNFMLNTIFKDHQGKILPLDKLMFKVWVNDHFTILVEKPKEFEKCYNMFMLMNDYFSCIPLSALESFLDYVCNNFDMFLKSRESKSSDQGPALIIHDICEFMSTLLKKFPPEADFKKQRTFHRLYEILSEFCTKYWKVTFCFCTEGMIVGAVGAYFPSYINELKKSSDFAKKLKELKKNSKKKLKRMAPVHEKKKIYYKYLGLDVVVIIMKRIFSDIMGERSKLFLFKPLSSLANVSDKEITKETPASQYAYDFLFKLLPSIIGNLELPDIMLKVIDFIDFVTFKKCKRFYKEKIFTKKLFRQVLVVLESVCVRVDLQFRGHPIINVEMFKILKELRTSVQIDRFWHKYDGKLIERYKVWWNAEPNHYIKVNAHTIHTLFFTASIFYAPENRQEFFRLIAEELQYDVYAGIMHIFEMKTMDSQFWIKNCLDLISEMVQNVSVHHDYIRLEEHEEAKHAFLAVMEICHSNEHLAEHIWMQLFPELWNILKEDEQQKILNREFLEPFRNRICSGTSTLPNADDVFINAALKCDPAFCSLIDIDKKHFNRSYYLQILSSTMENHLVLQNSYSKQHDDYYRTLNKIYITLEEDDLHSAFMQNLFPYAAKPVSEFQEGNIHKAHDSFKELIQIARSDSSFSSSEIKMYWNQLSNCEAKLSKWNFFSIAVAENLTLPAAVSFFKGNRGVTSKAFQTLTNCQNSNEILPSEGIKSAVTEIINAWKCLPQVFPSSPRYCLLQVIQQVTELREITELQNSVYKDKFNPLSIAHEIETLYSQWQECPYLMSDNPESVAELFLARYVSLRSMYEKFSGRAKKSSTQPVIPDCVRKVTAHRSCDSLISLGTVALKFQDIYLKDLRLKECSAGNAFKLIELKFLALLQKARMFKKSQLTETERYELMTKADSLMRMPIAEKLNSSHKGILGAYFWEIAAELEASYVCSKGYEYPENSRLWEIESEFCEYRHSENPSPENLERVVKSILKACEYGDTLVVIKRLPKILLILEVVEDRSLKLIAKILFDNYNVVPAKHWLLFLPFLTSCLYHSLITEILSKNEQSANSSDSRKRKMSAEVEKVPKRPKRESDGEESFKFGCDEEKEDGEKDEEKEHKASTVITFIIQELGKSYPQEVFFAIQSLRGIKNEIIGEGERIIYKKYKEIVDLLKKLHPSLISKLEEMLQDFQKIRPCVDHLEFKQILEKTYSFVHAKFMKDNCICSAKELICFLEKENILEARFSKNDKLDQDLKELLCFPECFKSLKLCTPEMIINQMRKISFVLSKANLKYQRPFILKEKCSFLSSFHHITEEIDIFGQPPFLGYKSHVKLKQILPKVETMKWNGCLVYKICILGDNGKVYPFIMMKDFCKEESLMSMRCVQALENLNLIFEQNAQISKSFFDFYFPRHTSISADLMLMPLQYNLIPYDDVYQLESSKFGDFSRVDYLFTLFSKNLALSCDGANKEAKMVESLREIKETVPDDTFIKWVKTFYPSPIEFSSFKTQFIKQLSLLIAAEYLFNMQVTKQLLISRDSGLVTAAHLQFNSEHTITTSYLLTPNISKFIEPYGILQITENVSRLFSCLKENKNDMLMILRLIKRRELSKDEEEKAEKVMEIISEKLDCADRDSIQIHLQFSTISYHPLLVDSFLDIKF